MFLICYTCSSSIYFFNVYNSISYYNLNNYVSVQNERKIILAKAVTYLVSNTLSVFNTNGI